MRAEQSGVDTLTSATGVDPVSERTWRTLVSLHGVCPPHNVFVTMATLKNEVSRTKARDDFQVLKNLPAGHLFQKETAVNKPVTREPQCPHPVGIADGAEVTALRLEVHELREAVLPRLGRLDAQVAMLGKEVQSLTDLLKFCDKTMRDLQQTVEPLQTLRTLLAKDTVAKDTVQSMVRTHDSWTTEKSVYNWLAAWVGWPLKTPQM